MDVEISVSRWWRRAWQMHHHTKAILRLDLQSIAHGWSLDGSNDVPESRRRDETVTAERGDSPPRTGPGGGDGSSFDVDDDYTNRKRIGLVLGPLAFVLVLALPTPTGLDPAGQAVAASAVWMAVWWVSEAVPIPITALLPIVLFPTTGATGATEAASPYANRLVFLFLGGFLIAVSIERWDLHRRIALWTITTVGTAPRRLILGFMLSTAFLSMWISNTATALMMTPIGLAVIHQLTAFIRREGLNVRVEEGEFRFGMTLMLSIAYAASIGGVGTLIGSPPNIIFAGFVRETYGIDISFAQWMAYGVPISVVGVFLCWLYLTRIILGSEIDVVPDDRGLIGARREALGPMTTQERLVLAVFGLVALGWLTRGTVLEPIVPAVDDAAIAIAGAISLFVIPVRDREGGWTFLLDWTTAKSIPWGVILLFGGGLSLAAGVEESGLGGWIGGLMFGLEGVDLLWIVVAVALLGVFLTEVTSNTAMTAMMIPILGAIAIGLSVHPFALMVAATTVASLAFMLPVATPPNAVVFASGYLTVAQMTKVGFALNLLGVVLVVLFVFGWLPIAWGIDLTTVPPWID